MRVLADSNVPEKHVAALRGDGHEVVWSRDIPELAPEATDDEIVAYAEREHPAVLSTDVNDFGDRETSAAVLVGTQEMTGGEVRTAVTRIDALPFDPTGTDPL